MQNQGKQLEERIIQYTAAAGVFAASLYITGRFDCTHPQPNPQTLHLGKVCNVIFLALCQVALSCTGRPTPSEKE